MEFARIRRGLVALSVALLGGICASSQVVAADAAAGQAAFAVCAACHGPQGQGIQAMNAPRLAGQAGWYVRRQLEAFRAGHRGTAPGDVYGMQMRPMANAVADPVAVDNLIAFLESLPAGAPAPATVQGDSAAGKLAYATCSACHGANGEGNQALGGPRLAGQDDWYLVRQIQSFNQGLRGYDPKDSYGQQMKPMAAMLATPQAINAVVAYINTLH